MTDATRVRRVFSMNMPIRLWWLVVCCFKRGQGQRPTQAPPRECAGSLEFRVVVTECKHTVLLVHPFPRCHLSSSQFFCVLWFLGSEPEGGMSRAAWVCHLGRPEPVSPGGSSSGGPSLVTMALSAGASQRLPGLAVGMATETQLRSIPMWADLPGELRDALGRNGVSTASDLCGLFDGSGEEAAGVSQGLVPGSLHGPVRCLYSMLARLLIRVAWPTYHASRAQRPPPVRSSAIATMSVHVCSWSPVWSHKLVLLRRISKRSQSSGLRCYVGGWLQQQQNP